MDDPNNERSSAPISAASLQQIDRKVLAPIRQRIASLRVHSCGSAYSGKVNLRTTLAFLFPLIAAAEVHTLTLRQAIDVALRQSPDVLEARLEQQKAQAAVHIAHDPFVPKVYAGSGAAYVSGYPMTIEGQPPSIFEAQTAMSLYNRPQSWELARVRENARGAAINTESKTDDVIFRIAGLYMDAAQIARTAGFARREVDALNSAVASARARISEGRELPIEQKRAELNQARARQRAEGLAADEDYADASLAVVLGFPADDRVAPVQDEGGPLASVSTPDPASADAAADLAIQNSRQIRLLESQLQAATFQVREQKAQRLPQLDLVAQYALLSKYNYTQVFTKFQRNNGELGFSVRIPVLVGTAPSGSEQQATAEQARLRLQVNETRNQTALEARKDFDDVHRAEDARAVARLDLDVARDQLSILLAQFDEGRATQRQIDEARFLEQEKWIAFYEAQHGVDRARLTLLHRTGTLLAALQ